MPVVSKPSQDGIWKLVIVDWPSRVDRVANILCRECKVWSGKHWSATMCEANTVGYYVQRRCANASFVNQLTMCEAKFNIAKLL